MTVKDSKRYADGGWGFYNFNHHEPKAPTAKLKPVTECAYCHIASAKKDEVWTQFYPLSGHWSRNAHYRNAHNKVTQKNKLMKTLRARRRARDQRCLQFERLGLFRWIGQRCCPIGA